MSPAAARSAASPTLTGLKADTFALLPLGSIKAAGWLKKQLLLQANGLGDIMWNTQPDMGGSAWLEGEHDAAHPPGNRSADIIHPRGPIYFEGAAHLCAALDDTDQERGRYKARAEAFVRAALKSVQGDGFFGPATGHDVYYWWPWAPIMRGLSRWYTFETSDKTKADILEAVQNYCMYMKGKLDQPAAHLNPPGATNKPTLLDAVRWLDILYFVQWTFANTKEGTRTKGGGDLRRELLALMTTLRSQGLDWMAVYDSNGPIKSIEDGMVDITRPVVRAVHHGKLEQHGVNVSQALKAAPLLSRWMSGNAEYDGIGYATFLKHWTILQHSHGQPTGMFSCDEHVGGREPHHGNELCSTVETLLSLEMALATFGKAELADYIEKIAYNILPSQTDDAVTKHQYVGQTNQIYAGVMDVAGKSVPYASDGKKANSYDIVQGVNCCSASVQHAWPRLTSFLWLKSGTGLVSAIIAPNVVTTQIGPADDQQTVSIETVTDYPFKGRVTYTVRSLTAPATFPLVMRGPLWAKGVKRGSAAGALYKVVPAGGRAAPYDIFIPAGTFADMRKDPAWKWEAGDRVEVTFPMTVTAIDQPDPGHVHSSYVQSGPLLFAYPLAFHPQPQEFEDRTFAELIRTNPDSFKIQIDTTGCRRSESSIDRDRPFSWTNAPVRIRVKARPIAWTPTGAALRDYAILPKSIDRPGDWSNVDLVPFGCTALRMAGLPSVA